MGLTFDAVAGEIPLVQRVWSARCDAATDFTSVAKGSCMIAFAWDGAGCMVNDALLPTVSGSRVVLDNRDYTPG